ncbi:MAG: DNA polymerase III subunit [Clostridia bacterium]|nr:DNA polymerase III subunit [Clostridia bacterium]
MYGYNVFHESILTKLINNARQGTNAAAYIFEGPAGLHKHNAALLFAKTLVCENTGIAPCCSCPACAEAQSGNHPDIIHVYPEKDRKTIGVDPIRDMLAECAAKPFSDRHKVFIIKDGDILTPAAQNALLKVLEEPPVYSVFIIICTDADFLLETVRSRSVRITFPPLDTDAVRRYIEAKYPADPRVDFLVSYCEGIPSFADEIINRDDIEEMREDALGLVPKILSNQKKHALDVSDYFDEHSGDAELLCDMMLMYLRDTLAYISGCPDEIVNTDKLVKISLLAGTYQPELIASGIDELVIAKKMLDKHIKPSAVILHAALSVTL